MKRPYRGKRTAKTEKRPIKFLLPALLVLFALGGIFSGVNLVRALRENRAGAAVYETLAETVITETREVTELETVIVSGQNGEQAPQTPNEPPEFFVNFDVLQAMNRQIVGWIRSEDGTINYPVAQGTDNEYYLNHLADGSVNRNGAIFMDFRNNRELTDRNTFLYGHNMRNGTMFASICRYSEPGYYENQPVLRLILPAGEYDLEVFAGCTVPGNSDIYQLTFDGDEELAAYVERVRAMSEFSTPVEVSGTDRLVTLSTCDYDYENARYVLFCKLVAREMTE